MPDRKDSSGTWLIRPGSASALTPNEGIAQEWMTSVAETSSRIFVLVGMIVRLSTSNNRRLFCSKSLEGTI